jgi:hypothetical protein
MPSSGVFKYKEANKMITEVPNALMSAHFEVVVRLSPQFRKVKI